ATASFADLDPSVRGARIVVVTESGDVRVDQVLPPGAFVKGSVRGWKTNKTHTTWQYVDRTKTLLSGISGVKILDKSKDAPGHVRVTVTGKNAVYPVVTGDEPLEAVIVLGNQTDGVAGLCGETAFIGGDCVFNRAANSVTCKKK